MALGSVEPMEGLFGLIDLPHCFLVFQPKEERGSFVFAEIGSVAQQKGPDLECALVPGDLFAALVDCRVEQPHHVKLVGDNLGLGEEFPGEVSIRLAQVHHHGLDVLALGHVRADGFSDSCSGPADILRALEVLKRVLKRC